MLPCKRDQAPLPPPKYPFYKSSARRPRRPALHYGHLHPTLFLTLTLPPAPSAPSFLSLHTIPRAHKLHPLLSISVNIASSFLNSWSRFPFPRLNRFHILLPKPIYIYVRKSKFSLIYSDRFTICGAAGQQQDQHWRQHE